MCAVLRRPYPLLQTLHSAATPPNGSESFATLSRMGRMADVPITQVRSIPIHRKHWCCVCVRRAPHVESMLATEAITCMPRAAPPETRRYDSNKSCAEMKCHHRSGVRTAPKRKRMHTPHPILHAHLQSTTTVTAAANAAPQIWHRHRHAQIPNETERASQPLSKEVPPSTHHKHEAT